MSLKHHPVFNFVHSEYAFRYTSLILTKCTINQTQNGTKSLLQLAGTSHIGLKLPLNENVTSKHFSFFHKNKTDDFT